MTWRPVSDTDTYRAWLPLILWEGIFTTRSREYQEIGHSVSLEARLPRKPSNCYVVIGNPTTRRDRSAAEGIAADLGYHPLALAVCSRALEAEIGLRSFDEFRAAPRR